MFLMSGLSSFSAAKLGGNGEFGLWFALQLLRQNKAP